MLKIICSLTFLLCHVLAYAQTDIKTYVGKNVVPISGGNLKVIGDAIGDARIVMLGEQDHGDATAFLAKTQLIKYLHEQKGFTVLAFESDFFGLNKGWDALPKTSDSINYFLKRNIFPVWGACTACSTLLYEYVPASFQTNNPLEMTGFDSQLSLTYSVFKLFPMLDSVFKHYQLPGIVKEDFDQFRNFKRGIDKNKDTSGHVKRREYLTGLRHQLQEKVALNDYWLMIMDNLIQENEQYQYYGIDDFRAKNARDVQMARNLAWLADVKYAGKKIIVWAHNYHISKHAGHYADGFLNDVHSMGHVFTADLHRMKDTYILGFTSRQGTGGRLGRKIYKIKKPGKNALESWINGEYEQAFLDFRAYNESRSEVESFMMAGSVRGGPFHSVHKAEWSKVFDGIFYIRDMVACEGMK